jgi:hypothetical protein
MKAEQQEKHDLEVGRIQGLKSIREGRQTEENKEKVALDAEKRRALVDSQARSKAGAQEKALKIEQRQAEIEAVRNIKRGKAESEEAERSILANDRENSQVAAKAKKVRQAEEKSLRQNQKQAEIEAVRNIKRGKAESEEAERSILANDRENAQVNAKAKAVRQAEEKSLLQNQKQAEIEAVRNIKRGQADTEELERSILANERAKSVAEAERRVLSAAGTKAMLKEQRQAEIDGIRNMKRGKSIEDEKEREILINERAMALSTSLQRQESFQREKALHHEVAVGEAQGRRVASQQRARAQDVATNGVGPNNRGDEWGGKSRSGSSRYTSLKMDEIVGTAF